jgi:hypothetical protein
MNWKDLPIDEIRSTLRMEENPKRAFLKIIDLCKQKLPSKIWDEFVNMNIEVLFVKMFGSRSGTFDTSEA